MNSVHVYKRHNVVSINECIHIPAGDTKWDAANRAAKAKEEAANGMPAKTGEAVHPAAAAEKKDADGSPEKRPNGAVSKDARPAKAEAPTGKPDAGQKGKKPEGGGRALSKEELSSIYKKELRELAQSAAENAYYDALNKKKHELKDCVSNVQKVLDELIREHEEFIEQYTGELKYMAVDIAEKMLLDRISADESVLQGLVLRNIKNVKNAQWINVEVSERLVEVVGAVKKELEQSEFKGKTNVIAVADKEDTCRITTEEGTVVSTIRVQAENLRKVFREAEREKQG